MFEGCVAAKGPVQIFEIDAHEICASETRSLYLSGYICRKYAPSVRFIFDGALCTPTISAAHVAIGDLARKAALFSLPNSHWDICLWWPLSKFDALFGEHDSGGGEFIH